MFNNVKETKYRMDVVLEYFKVSIYSYLLTLFHRSWIDSTLKMEAIRSSETTVNKIPTRRHIPDDGILQGILEFACMEITE
jgi:hypothetical protein